MAKIMKDGKPSTSFSRQDREWVKNMSGGGGDITVEELSVTENGTYTAPEGKAYSPVTVNVPSSDFSTTEVTINVAEGLEVFISLPFTTSTESIDFLSPYWISGYSDNSVDVVLYKGKASGHVLSGSDEVEVAVTGDISEEDGTFFITGSGTITFTSPVT